MRIQSITRRFKFALELGTLLSTGTFSETMLTEVSFCTNIFAICSHESSEANARAIIFPTFCTVFTQTCLTTTIQKDQRISIKNQTKSNFSYLWPQYPSGQGTLPVKEKQLVQLKKKINKACNSHDEPVQPGAH